MLTVADNGEGFDTSNESEGQGLTSMQRRAQRLKGILEITSGERLGNDGADRGADVMSPKPALHPAGTRR